MLDPMAESRAGVQDECMTAMTLHEAPVVDLDRAPTGGRDPAHVAYDHAAALLTSARALEAATRDPGAVPALAPTLACLDVSLDELAADLARLAGLLAQGAETTAQAQRSLAPVADELTVI